MISSAYNGNSLRSHYCFQVIIFRLFFIRMIIFSLCTRYFIPTSTQPWPPYLLATLITSPNRGSKWRRKEKKKRGPCIKTLRYGVRLAGCFIRKWTRCSCVEGVTYDRHIRFLEWVMDAPENTQLPFLDTDAIASENIALFPWPGNGSLWMMPYTILAVSSWMSSYIRLCKRKWKSYLSGGNIASIFSEKILGLFFDELRICAHKL